MPVSSEEAREIYQHLVRVMNRSGYGSFASEAIVLTQRNNQSAEYSRQTDLDFLMGFIDNTIAVLEQNSNDNFPELLGNLNKFTTDSRIENIIVSGVESPVDQSFNLAELPSYRQLANEFSEVREAIIQNMEDNG